MSRQKYPSNIIEQAQEVTAGWGQINPAMTVGTMTLTVMSSDIGTAADLEAQIVKLEKQLSDKRNQRDILQASLWDKVKRVRNYVKGSYGDDSTQLKLVGGRSLSDRKPALHRTASAE